MQIVVQSQRSTQVKLLCSRAFLLRQCEGHGKQKRKLAREKPEHDDTQVVHVARGVSLVSGLAGLHVYMVVFVDKYCVCWWAVVVCLAELGGWRAGEAADGLCVDGDGDGLELEGVHCRTSGGE